MKQLFNQFVIIRKTTVDGGGKFYVTYDKDTKVMYYIGFGTYQSVMCPVYGADGKVMIYKGEGEDYAYIETRHM